MAPLLKRSYIVARDSAHFLAAAMFVSFLRKRMDENYWDNQKNQSMTTIQFWWEKESMKHYQKFLNSLHGFYLN